MTNKLILPAAALVAQVAYAGGFSPPGIPRELVRERVDPVRVVWASEGSVTGATTLLKPKSGQVPEAGWKWEHMADGCCVMTNGGATTGLILDFGRELHGGLRIAASARSAKGMRMRVRFGESVSETMSDLGERGACNDHAIRDSVIDLPFMGTREIGNTGFRFVRLDLVTPGHVTLESVRAVSLMRPMKPIGSFKCSDERLNRIFETAVRTAHLCCQDYLWDGIKRDRLVWMGDMHPETMTILSVFGAAEVLPETLDLMAKVTPPGDWMNNFPTYTLCWIRNLAAWYRFTGDREFLGRFDGYLEKTFAHVTSVITNGVWAKAGEYGAFLDWPTHHNSEAELGGAQALAVLAMDDLRFLLSESGRSGAADEAGRLLERMRKVHPDPHGAKSAAAMLALSGLRDPSEMFVSALGQNGHAGVSTFYGYYMLEAMSLAGQGLRALDTVRDYWGGMLDMGATSFWEDFNLAWTNNACRIDEMPAADKKDVHGDYGEFCYKGFRHSLCHGWSSGPAAWCMNNVLGIRPLDVGCKTVEVKPFLGYLDWAEGAMALPTGEAVLVRAEKKGDGTLAVSVTAPDWVKVVQMADADCESAPEDGGFWPDDKGIHINAHGGGVMWHEGRYYWYGEHKGAGRAGNVAHATAVHCYSSTNLTEWIDEGASLTTEKGEGHDLEEGCVIERPKVVYCPNTGKFVMYFHLELKTDSENPGYRYGSARVGIAVNDRPTGVFTYLTSRRPNAGVWPQGIDTNGLTFAATADARAIANWRNGGVNETVKNCKYVFAGTFDRGQTSRDQTLFVDDDGKAYHVYTSEHNSTLHISELSDDFVNETGRYWRLAEKDWTEAPAICKHGGWYFVLGSGCTGWAPNAARYYRSRSIAGPWERMDNPCRGTDGATGLGADLTWGGQSTCIFPVQEKPGTFIAMFDRWRPKNAIDGRYVWREIVFSDDGRMTIPWHKGDSADSLMRRVRAKSAVGGGAVELADGVYNFYSSSATNMRFHVSNHDQPDVRPVFLPFIGVTNVSVVAKNAKFVMHGMGTAILVRDSLGVSFKGITIEWEKPFFAKAEIVGFEDGKTRVRFPARDKVIVEDGKLMLCGEDWKVSLRDGNVFDRTTHEMIERTADVRFSGKGCACETGDFLIDVDLSRIGAGAKVGDVYVMRNGYRPHPIVCLDRAKDTVFEDFVFRDGFGMGILAQLSENVTLRGGGCYPRDRNEYNSNTIDATHFSNCRGTVTVENCRFEGMMDDALNVHSTSMGIVAKPSANSIRCRYMHPQAVGFGVFAAGDAIRFIAGKTLENGAVGRVKSVETHDEREITLMLEEPIPQEYGVGDAVENADWQCAVVFRNNTVANNRARGVLFTTPHRIVCEGNFFDHVSGSAILFAGDAQGWYESGACEDVVIRKNRFCDCLTSVFQYCDGLVSIHPEVKDLKGQKRRYHRNIIIEDNDIETFDIPLLYALSADNVIWRNNRVTKHDRYRGWDKPELIKIGCGRVEWY